MESCFPDEVWLLIADLFLSRATLRALCLTCKRLNNIFTPVLYRNVFTSKSIGKWKHDRKNLSELRSESHLKFTRHFDLGHTLESCTPAVQVLDDLFKKMTGLVTCKVWTHPDTAYHFCHPQVTHLSIGTNSSENLGANATHYYDWPPLPAFKNLQCLDLRIGLGRIDISSLARVLLDSPHLNALALEVKTRIPRPIHDQLSPLVSAFEEGRELRQNPTFRLQLTHLVLGTGFLNCNRPLNIDDPDGPFPEPPYHDRLGRLVDLAKLQTFRCLNQLSEGPNAIAYSAPFDHKQLLQAKNLRKLAVDIITFDVISLVRKLRTESGKTLCEIEVTGNPPSSNTPGQWLRHLSELPSGWRKIHLLSEGDWFPYHTYGEDRSDDGFNRIDMLLNEPNDIEELSMPHALNYFETSPFTNYHRLRILTTRCENGMEEAKVAKMFFRCHNRAMRDQGLTSQLKYVGVNNKVYARIWRCEPDSPPFTYFASIGDKENSEDSADYDVIELEKEEAQTFHLSTTSQSRPIFPLV
ncbi:hypothetical protein EG329_010281 [Mollisiaceae sp. DMI_Dod_QoI]|nr:hypothetical protein EG329_010281 [Helotiales sp. DMI_Dod_QoI]